ncbi:hypothetical protein CIW48_26980 [Methylobacterium sp. P1-11]|nr:hypothetical protein CIW48_26980 [Methylobacterium sp. P1-11]
MAHLATVPEVIEALGGRVKVQELFSASQQRVFNWIARGTFPPATFEPITAAVEALGHTVSPMLWKSVPVSVVIASRSGAAA